MMGLGESDGNPFFRSDKPNPDRTTSLWVDANDLFAWGSADCVNVAPEELGDLYKMYIKDPKWC